MQVSDWLVRRWPRSWNTGFAGERCEVDVDECASAPCQNGATCENRVAEFACTCPPGYGGNVCEVRLNNCEFQVSVLLCWSAVQIIPYLLMGQSHEILYPSACGQCSFPATKSLLLYIPLLSRIRVKLFIPEELAGGNTYPWL
jgi:EGF-like domain